MILRLEPSSPVSGISFRVRMLYKTGKNPDTGTGTETLVPAANMNTSFLAEQHFFTSEVINLHHFNATENNRGGSLYMRDINFYARQFHLKIKVYNKINLYTETDAQIALRLKLLLNRIPY